MFGINTGKKERKKKSEESQKVQKCTLNKSISVSRLLGLLLVQVRHAGRWYNEARQALGVAFGS